MSVFVDVVANEDVGKGAMVIIYTNFPEGTEYLWQRPVYTLQTNGDNSPPNKIIIFKK